MTSDGQFVMFGGFSGGQRFPSNTVAHSISAPDGVNGAWFNDMWRWNPSTQLWTWMSGGPSFSVIADYTTRGVYSELSVIGAREPGAFWRDSSNPNKMYLFAGEGFNEVATPPLDFFQIGNCRGGCLALMFA